MIHLLIFIGGLVLGMVCAVIACLSWLVWALCSSSDPDECSCGYNARRHQDMYP